MINNAIEERAERLLVDSKSFKVPINLTNCATFLNITVNSIQLEDGISGFLAIKGKVAQIGFNSKHSENRTRFTVAHELGHYVLHAQSEPVFIDKANDNKFSYLFRDENSSSGEYRKEREANNFAAALLMPKKLIYHEMKKAAEEDGDKNLVECLSQKFNVSSKAMEIRLFHLGYSDYEM